MKKGLVAAVVVLLSLLAARAAMADARYTDPAGDSGGAPDVTSVNVTNDAAGNLTITVGTNQPALAGDALLGILFDTDGNPSTGGDGVEFMLVAGTGGSAFVRWDGTQFVAAGTASANSSYANGLLTFRINKADLANASSFAFYVISLQVGANNEVIARDDAPDGTAVYTYVLTTPPPPPLTLKASAPVAVPARPAAGKPFSVRIAVTRGDTNAPLAAGTVACKVTVGPRPLRATGSVRAGRAACAMAVPATARGKTIRGTIKVTFRNVSVTKPFSYRVP